MSELQVWFISINALSCVSAFLRFKAVLYLMHITFRSHLLYMILFTSFTFAQAQLGGDPMFEIVEHVEVLNPESVESCVECPTLEHRFEVGDVRNKRDYAGLKEHVTFYLTGPTADSCSLTFSESSSNRVISETTNEKTIELPLDPGLVTMRVDYEGSGCPCESSEIKLIVIAPAGINYSLQKFPKVEVRYVNSTGPNGDNIRTPIDSTRKWFDPEASQLWHIKNKVSAGANYRMILQPVGVSFARLNIWEGESAPDSANITGSYFDSMAISSITHAGQDRYPWNSGVFSGASNAQALNRNIDVEGIPGADRVFGAFDCKDVRDPVPAGSLTWSIKTYRETSTNDTLNFFTTSQEFIHVGDPEKKKPKRALSYVGKAGICTNRVRVGARTNTDGYYTSQNQTVIESCN